MNFNARHHAIRPRQCHGANRGCPHAAVVALHLFYMRKANLGVAQPLNGINPRLAFMCINRYPAVIAKAGQARFCSSI